MWGTFALFEQLLRNFETHLQRARHIHSEGPKGPDELHIAVSGFLEFCPQEEWGQSHFRFIMNRLEGDYALVNLQGRGDHAPALQAFACLGLGAILGMYTAEQIDDAGFTLGEMFLSQFLFDADEEIARRYALVVPSRPPSLTDG